MNEPHTQTCQFCNGSGEGMADGTRCYTCKSKGEVWSGKYICPDCGETTENEDGPCDKCGRCPMCGDQYDADTKVCPTCKETVI